MANDPSNKTEAQKKKKKSAPILPAADTTEKYNPSKDLSVLETLIAKQGTIDADTRAAYDLLLTDLQRIELGAKTRSLGVLRNAVDWAVIIDKVFTDYPAQAQEVYSKVRFKFLLDRTSALGAAILGKQAKTGDLGSDRLTAAAKEATLRKTRNDLLFKLEAFAGKREEPLKVLAEAKGRADTVDSLGDSVLKMVKLGREWIGVKDKVTPILAEGVGLSTAYLDDVVATAKEVTSAATEVMLDGPGRGSFDPPEVNLVEGAVLYEMAHVCECFERGHKRTPLIPRLVPSDATRHVIDPRKKPAEEPAADASAPQADTPQAGPAGMPLAAPSTTADTTKPGP